MRAKLEELHMFVTTLVTSAVIFTKVANVFALSVVTLIP
jgi:hypothetical protein